MPLEPLALEECPPAASIVGENQCAVAPKTALLVTTELMQCRAIAVFGETKNFLAHIYQDGGEEGHTLEKMKGLLEQAAAQLDMKSDDLKNRKISVICGRAQCKEIDTTLNHAFIEMGLDESALWHKPADADLSVYAAVLGNDVYLAPDSVELDEDAGKHASLGAIFKASTESSEPRHDHLA